MLAVCLGFQLAVIEFARNVVGLTDAKSGESPEPSGLIIYNRFLKVREINQHFYTINIKIKIL